jgi:hypothetical protein
MHCLLSGMRSRVPTCMFWTLAQTLLHCQVSEMQSVEAGDRLTLARR